MPRVLARAAADGALLLLLLLPLVVVVTDRPLISGHAPFVLQKSRPLHWAGRDFTTKREFRSFLTSRGGNYETWVKRHPGVPDFSSGARARDVFIAWVLGAVLLYRRSFGGGRRSVRSDRKSRPRVQTSPSVPARQHAPPRAALPPHRAPIANAVALARGITAFATGIRERGEDFGLTRSDVVVYAVAASAAIVTGWVVVVWATS